jgi:hypothetical protein
VVDTVAIMKVSGIEARVLMALRVAQEIEPIRANAAISVLAMPRQFACLSTGDDLFSSTLLHASRSDDSFSSSPWDETSTD